MEASKLDQILKKRDNNYISWVNVSRFSSGLSADEARELEKLGYGELHGGDNGIFWLYPVNGGFEEREEAIS